jgi:hypothetical protein
MSVFLMFNELQKFSVLLFVLLLGSKSRLNGGFEKVVKTQF